jgi:hypothetical protein
LDDFDRIDESVDEMGEFGFCGLFVFDDARDENKVF